MVKSLLGWTLEELKAEIILRNNASLKEIVTLERHKETGRLSIDMGDFHDAENTTYEILDRATITLVDGKLALVR